MLSSGFTTDPPTLEDDLKIDSIYDHYNYKTRDWIGWHWIRLSDEGTDGIWKDPDDKENLTFTNWREHRPIHYSSKSHAVMLYGGKWYDLHPTYRASTFIEVLC